MASKQDDNSLPPKKRDDFSESTKRILAQRVNYHCSNPDCQKGTTGPDTQSHKSISIGVAAHVTAASEGGPRHDPTLTSEERRHAGNGIWLCHSCSRLIDTDESRYTVDLLKEWKKTAEQRALRVLERASAPPTSTAHVLPVPADLADFTGRQAQIQRVRAQLDRRGAVTITGIHGMGGIGKTALAVHVAHQLIAEGRFSGARLYIDLRGAGTSPVDPVDALEGLLNAILEPDPNRPRNIDTLSALWRRAIQGQDALLILDNAADATQVRPLLPGCPTCSVLITSRQRFTLPGARRLDLHPMPRAEARNLLLELAPRLDGEGADQIADLCGRLPQALRIAGNYLNLNDDVTPDAYAGMLADERNRLAQLRDPDDPDLNVYATISLSVDQLDLDARRAWALLSLFTAPFDLPAAAALWDQPEDRARAQLQALRNRSLATYDRESTRYHQHDLVRLVAADDLGSADEAESYDANLRMALHYERVASTTADFYREGGAKVLQALALFDLEWPHIRAGQAWAAAHTEDDDEAARLCSTYAYAAHQILPLRIHPRRQITWLKAAARAARQLGDQTAQGTHLGNLGIAYRQLGETQKAIEQYQQALEISREIGDRRGEGVWLGNLGIAYRRLGETQKAIEQCQQALEIAREIGDRRWEANHLANLGVAYSNLGETQKAIEQYQQALEISREIGDRRLEGNILTNLGVAYRGIGKAHEAIGHHTAALEISREIGDRRGEGNRLGNLGIAYLRLGETQKAIDYLHQALDLSETIDDPPGVASACYNLACAYVLLEDPKQALPHLRRALTWRTEPYCRLAAEDTDFDAIRNEPAFQGLLGEFCPS